MGVVINPDGRLLDLIDQTHGLRAVMEFDVIYSLADRPCQICRQARRADAGRSVALVKIRNRVHPKGHLITLCEEHAAEWESRRRQHRNRLDHDSRQVVTRASPEARTAFGRATDQLRAAVNIGEEVVSWSAPGPAPAGTVVLSYPVYGRVVLDLLVCTDVLIDSVGVKEP